MPRAGGVRATARPRSWAESRGEARSQRPGGQIVTAQEEPRTGGAARHRVGDGLFRGVARAAGMMIVVILAGVAVFLTVEGVPAFTADPRDIPGDGGIAAYIAPLV